MPHQRTLQHDSFHGVRISDPMASLLYVMALNESCLLSYLLLRVIKAEALSLSITVFSCFNFKYKEIRYASRPKEKKKNIT
jgi:hypothetical protein